MKNLVLKVPTFVFSIGILTPILIFAYMVVAEELLVEMRTFKILVGIASILKLIWLFSIVDYFQSKLDNFNYLKLIYFFLVVDGLLTSANFFIVDSQNIFTDLTLLLLPIGIHMATTVFVTILVSKVFYERAVWFIVIEIFTLVVGVVTLTPEIKRN